MTSFSPFFIVHIFIALLLQEMKAKSNMEGKYVKKNAENQVHQNQQRSILNEQELKDKLDVRK